MHMYCTEPLPECPYRILLHWIMGGSGVELLVWFDVIGRRRKYWSYHSHFESYIQRSTLRKLFQNRECCGICSKFKTSDLGGQCGGLRRS